MKLAVLGLATLVVGLVQGIPGLEATGAFWILAGLLTRVIHRARTARTDDQDTAPSSGRDMAVNTAIMLAVGLPSLAIGIFEPGIDSSDEVWRWLPIGLGGFATLIAVVAALMYLLGAGMSVTADSVGVPDKPATITIRSMRETGTYVNERPRLEFALLVEPDGMPSWEVTKRATVPFTAMGSLRVGAGFHAKVVGPDRPKAMTIDWGAPVADSGAHEHDVTTRLDELDRLRRDGTITPEEYQAQRQRVLDSI